MSDMDKFYNTVGWLMSAGFWGLVILSLGATLYCIAVQ